MIGHSAPNIPATPRFMSGFVPLLRKEMRFLMKPVIALFLVINAGQIILLFGIHFFDPSFFENLINTMRQGGSPLVTWFVRPVLARGAMDYMYATLFLFALIHEHTTRSREQLDMLPVRRMTTLAAKFCALATWLAILHGAALFLFVPIRWVFEKLWVITPEIHTPEEYIRAVIYNLREILGILAVTAVGMLGYVAAVSVRRFRVAVGTAVVFIGFAAMSRYVEIAEYFFRGDVQFAGFRGLKMYEFSAAYEIIPHASAVIVLVAASLILHQRFGGE